MRKDAVIVLLVLAIAIFAGCVSTPQSQPQLKQSNWPNIALANDSLSGPSTPATNQLVARFLITNPGPREISIEKLQISQVVTIGNIERLARNGNPKVYIGNTNTLIGTGTNWATITKASTGTASDIKLPTPLTITPGQTVAFDIKVDTTATRQGDAIRFVLDNMNWVVDLQSEAAHKESGIFNVVASNLDY